MIRAGINCVVYHGDLCLGQLTVTPLSNHDFHFPDNVIRIHHLSPLSERCLPISILHTISSIPILFKLESPISSSEQPHLINLHASCFHCLQTAVVLVRDRNEEVHLVAMPSRQKNFPCFWCFSAPSGLYLASLRMLNMRSLAIVFDLDETLIVANTMKSFEDRIEALRGWIAREVDPVRVAGMSLELRRYADDRAMLKQFSECDYAMDNGKMHRVQFEKVHPLPGNQEGIVRPVIRLTDQNIVLTRINPEIRDTSVFVRLRPAWEDLRCYLTAKGRRRFEVYVCTMAERDYALEMWRLLDPEANLIHTEQILDRVVCVKPGCRKSLLNVFQDGICHPRMAMVIDDRINVWEENDQTRVHVVPPFTPYYSPQAELTNVVPVLCVARNVSCNVRGGFFREFDENFLRQVGDIHFEDDTANMPPAPDVGNYLVTEETCSVPNGSVDAATSDATIGVEPELKSTQLNGTSVTDAPRNPLATSLDKRPEISNMNIAGVLGQAPSQTTQVSWRQDSIIPECDSDPKGKFTFSKPGQDIPNKNTVDLSFFSRVSSQHASPATVQQQGSSFNEKYYKRSLSQNQTSSNPKVLSNSMNVRYSAFSADVLHEIGRRCGSKVEFRSAPSIGPQMQLSMEVFFSGEKIGFGVGKTIKYAQQQAAYNGLQCLAAKYREYVGAGGAAVDTNISNNLTLLHTTTTTTPSTTDNGFVCDVSLPSSPLSLPSSSSP